MKMNQKAELKNIGTALLLFCFIQTYSQSVDTFKVSGTIISANSGLGIPYGTVSLENGKQLMCDKLGRFTFTNLASGKMSVSFKTFAFNRFDTVLNITNSNIGNFIWEVYPECWRYSIEAAQKHIDFNDVEIQVPSGIIPVVNTTVEQFKKEFNLHFSYYTLKESDIKKRVCYTTVQL